MSLILEALKKSEAQRRLGAAPDFGTPFHVPRRPRYRLAWLIVAILVIAAGVAWRLRGSPPSTSPGTPPATRSIPPHSAAPSAPAPLHLLPSRGSAPSPDSAARAASQPVTTAPTIAAAQGRSAQSATAPPPAPHPAPVATPTVTAHDANPPPTMTPPTPSDPSTPKTTPSAGDGTPARAAKTPGTIGLDPPSATHPPTGTDAQSYSALPFNVRKALPELSLRMHVYAKDPRQRFVILNDARLAEGDSTAEGVHVREILPDGVVLEFQGHRFFYPRDGL